MNLVYYEKFSNHYSTTANLSGFAGCTPGQPRERTGGYVHVIEWSWDGGCLKRTCKGGEGEWKGEHGGDNACGMLGVSFTLLPLRGQRCSVLRLDVDS